MSMLPPRQRQDLPDSERSMPKTLGAGRVAMRDRLDHAQADGKSTSPPRRGEVRHMLAIVWHSRTGASRALAAAVAQGAGKSGVLMRAEEAGPERLEEAGGFVFVCPENLGTMSGEMKAMFDRAYYPLLGRVEGLPFATVVAAGSDGQGAQQQIERIVTGWRLRRIAPPMIVRFDAQTPEAILADKRPDSAQLKACHELGQGFAEGLRMGIF